MVHKYSTEVVRQPTSIIKLVLRDNEGKQIARASLVLIMNEVNPRPYGLLEDVYVTEEHRHDGHATRLVQEIIEIAQQEGCYKLIATSRYTRPLVHRLYLKLGFRDHGKEFRIDFPEMA
jgi:GNAT superfamily N-acetyltransferase